MWCCFVVGVVFDSESVFVTRVVLACGRDRVNPGLTVMMRVMLEMVVFFCFSDAVDASLFVCTSN